MSVPPLLPPPVPERRRSLEEATQKLIESHRLKQSAEQSQPTTVQQTGSTTVNRKSVSFDLSDNEYIPVFGHEEPPKSAPVQTENLADLFLSQFSQESEGDGYEVPISYSRTKRQQQQQPVKSILRSPSPNASIPLSSDRPLRTTHLPHANQTVTSAIVHATRSSDEEIERENPFRKEFLENRPYENIYEEIASSDKPKDASKRHSSDSDSNEQPATSRYATPKKIRPKSAYSTVESDTYTEIMPKSSQTQSTENLLQASETSQTLPKWPAHKSTGSLIDRPKHKPPLPPKPVMPTPSTSSLTSPPTSHEQSHPTIKHADVLQNEALKIFQSEMQRGNFYEFKHDAKTNKIIKVAPPVVPPTLPSKDSSETGRPKAFSQESPLPPIPAATTYTKVYKRNVSAERPPESPPPPPINLSTLPTSDKLRKIESGDGPIVEILPKTLRRDAHHENSPEYSLVTEATHREILLHENELRNALQQEEVVVTESTTTTSRIPLRRAPAPPQPATPTIEQHEPQQTPPQQQQIFPQTQILPVQYSQLPSPQQPGYFHAYAPTPMTVVCPSGGYSFVVSDTNRVLHHPNAVPNINPYHPSMPNGSYIVQSPPQPLLASPMQFHYNQNQPNYLNSPNWTTSTSYTIDSHPNNLRGYRQPAPSLQQDIHQQSHAFDHNSNRHFEQIISNRNTTNTIATSSSHYANTNTNSSAFSSSQHIYDEAFEPTATTSTTYADDSETVSSFSSNVVPIATSPSTSRDISLSRPIPATPTSPLMESSPTLTTFGKQTSV